MDDDRVLRVVGFQARDDVAVDLHHMQFMQMLQQRARQRTQTGADLHHVVIRLRADTAHDVGDDGLVNQEILAKLFFCFMPVHAAPFPAPP